MGFILRGKSSLTQVGKVGSVKFFLFYVLFFLWFSIVISKTNPDTDLSYNNLHGSDYHKAVRIDDIRNKCERAETFQSAVNCMKKKITNRKKTFLQIGANDGQTNDPLYHLMSKEKENWIGLLVEPTPENYEKLLKLHYGIQDWSFYNGAIASADLCINNEITFYHGFKAESPHWIYDGQVNNVNPKGPHNKKLKQSKIPCLSSILELIEKYGSREFRKHVALYGLDLLQTDIECMDVEVLKVFPWRTKENEDSHPYAIAVNNVHYESLDDCMGEESIKLAENILKSHDFNVYPKGGDGRDTYASRKTHRLSAMQAEKIEVRDR